MHNTGMSIHTHIHTYREREGERERGEGEGRGARHVRMVYTHEEKATCRITLKKKKIVNGEIF